MKGGRWNAIFDEPGSIRAVAVLRIMLGPLVIAHLQPFLQAMERGSYYADTFYVPWIDGYPEAPREVYFALLWICVGTSVLTTLGALSRVTVPATLLLVAYNFFLSQTHFRHNRNFLLVVLLFVALLPSGKVLSIDSLWSRWRTRKAPDDVVPTLWPLWLVRFEMASVYLSSGGSKLLDPDWWGGLVTHDRVLRYSHLLDDKPIPRWFVELIRERAFHSVFAKVAILTELIIGLGLWFRRTRLLAVWLAIVFHLSIELSARVQVFSFLALGALLFWAVPKTRDRVLTLRADRRVARVLRVLVRVFDWLARFDVQTWDPASNAESDPKQPSIHLRDRDGTELTGAAAVRVVLSRFPVCFFVIAPWLLPGLRSVWDRTLRRVAA